MDAPDAAPQTAPPSDVVAAARRFNTACRAVALLWLVVTIPLGLIRRPTDSDFQQFYLGGVMVWSGRPDQLYPIHKPGSQDNPGMKPESDLRPAAARARDARGVPDITRWMLPPPSALLFVPFASLTYAQAEWLWTFLLIGCTWGVAVIAGRVYRELVGPEVASRWPGVLALLVVLSPMACRAVRIRNDTPPIALAIGVAALGLLRHDRPRAAVAIVVGALLKYATLALLPLVVAARRWRTLAWTAGVGLAFVVAAWAVMGSGPYRAFAAQVAPTLVRPSGFPGNQTFAGLLFRTTHARPLGPPARAALLGGAVATLLAVVVLLFRRARHGPHRADLIFPGAAALVAWVMMFAPVAWEHWPIFLCPFWGWLIWETRAGVVRGAAATAALVLMAFPLSIFTNDGFLRRDFALPEPWNSSQLWGVALVLVLAAARLATRPAVTAVTAAADAPPRYA